MKSKLKIKTSFVSPVTLKRYVEEGYLPVFVLRSIANSELIGKWSGTSIHLRDYSPSQELFRKKRDGHIEIEEFRTMYAIEQEGHDFIELISKLEVLTEISKANGIILMGYGSNSDICHRSVLSKLLNDSGLLENEIKEIEI